MQKCIALGLVAITIVLLAGPDRCSAVVIFDNGNHIGNGRLASDGNRSSDDFRFLLDTLVTDVHWKGAYLSNVPPATDTFTINIYNDSGSGQPTVPIPGSAIYSTNVVGANRAPTGEITLGTYTVYGYSSVIPAFLALGGTNYWLEIFNNTTGDWYWSMDPSAGNSASSEFGGAWVTVGDANTFQLTNDLVGIPEAGSLVVWSVLMGMGMIARRLMPR